MKRPSLLVLFLAVGALGFRAEGQPLLAIPGPTIIEIKFDTPPEAPWNPARGRWGIVGGVMRAAELTAEKHVAVSRLPNKLQDFVIEYEFRFAGAESTSISINAAQCHLARMVITPKSVTIQRDDGDYAGPDKTVIFVRLPAELAEGWHKVRLEMVGDTMLGKVGDLIAYGTSARFRVEKSAPGLTVRGQSVDFRNLHISEATLNPDWEGVKANLPKPGEKAALVATEGRRP